MSQDRTYAACTKQDGDRRAKRFCKIISLRNVRTFNITMVISLAILYLCRFVEDEHFCYFDDMYSPDYTCFDILKSIISQIKTGKIPSDDVAFLDKGIAKIAAMEAYEEYGSPFCVMDWRKFMDTL